MRVRFGIGARWMCRPLIMFELDFETRYGVRHGCWWSASLLSTRRYIMCRARYFYLCSFYKHIWIRVTCKGVDFEFEEPMVRYFYVFSFFPIFFSFLSFALLCSFFISSAAFWCCSASKWDEMVVSLWMLG